MAFINPLDLQTIFVNVFAGSLEIFVFIAIIVIAALSARFRMPGSIALVMFAIFGVFLSAYVSGIYLLVVLFAGIAIFYGIARVMKY